MKLALKPLAIISLGSHLGGVGALLLPALTTIVCLLMTLVVVACANASGAAIWAGIRGWYDAARLTRDS